MAYLLLSALLLGYLANGYALLAWALLTRGRLNRRREELQRRGEEALASSQWPTVLTQLPLFNEVTVAARLINAVAAMEYPHGLHRIKVLDDSTDETCGIVDALAARWRARGVDIEVVRRAQRSGFKAGALAHGLRLCDAEFVAVFDADFVPPRDFLLRTVPVLVADTKLGWVQARWEHLNAGANSLTRGQAVGMDAHFAIEQTARSTGLLMAFNGSAGVWRRRAIDDAGGWSDATLTEDLDLSCRAYLLGWRGLLLPDLAVPAEVPASAVAYQAQQFRWAKGSLQTARRLLPSVWRSDLSLLVKVQTTVHLTQYLLHPLLIALALLTPWMAVRAPLEAGFAWSRGWQILAACALAGGTYFSAQRMLARPWRTALAGFGCLLFAGTGPALSNTRAVIEAMLGRRSSFLRTPKRGSDADLRYRAHGVLPRWVDALFLAYCFAAIVVALRHGWMAAVPMLAFCASGSASMIFLGWEKRPQIFLPEPSSVRSDARHTAGIGR